MQLRPPGITPEDAAFVERYQLSRAALLRRAAAVAGAGAVRRRDGTVEHLGRPALRITIRDDLGNEGLRGRARHRDNVTGRRPGVRQRISARTVGQGVTGGRRPCAPAVRGPGTSWKRYGSASRPG